MILTLVTRFIHSVLLFNLLLITFSSQAADSEYEQWLKKTQGEFQNYLDENDKEFINFLNKKWEPVDVEKTIIRDPEPKPIKIPVADLLKKTTERTSDSIPEEKIQPIVIAKPVVEKIPNVKNPIPSLPDKTKDHNFRTVEFTFFGEQVHVEYHKDFKQNFRSPVSNESIATYWKNLASQPHIKVIEQLSERAKELQLNDWGSALLFDQFSREMQGSNQRNQTSRQLTSWFLLVKAGFNARIAYNDQVFLLIPSDQQLFGTTFFTFNNQRFYSVSLNKRPMKPGKVFTYSGSHSEGKRNLNFSNPNNFITNKNRITRDLSFDFNDERFKIQIQYSKALVNYFKTFPQLDLENYFTAGMPSETAYSLLNQLKPVVEGQSETEAVNRLLRFVQTAFEYKTDDDQFRQENYLFPLETLHYPYSDCEDRAALFAWLTESLLGLDVVILDFPGHIATAVEFSQPVKGDSWKLNGKRYTVADPTYVNANAGMTMPQYKNKAPKLVAF